MFTANQATNGGGLLVTDSALTCLGCRFEDNVATTSGGGMRVVLSSLTMDQSAFIENEATARGAALDLIDTVSYAELAGVDFYDNHAQTQASVVHLTRGVPLHVSGGLTANPHNRAYRVNDDAMLELYGTTLTGNAVGIDIISGTVSGDDEVAFVGNTIDIQHNMGTSSPPGAFDCTETECLFVIPP